MKKWLILGGLLCLFGGLASASIIPTFTNETGGGSLFTYNYSVTLDSLQNLVTGNQLCFSDVFGLTGTPTAPTDWNATNNTSSACPINSGTGVSGTPTNTAPSVLYTYTGTTTVNGAPSGKSLGTFSLQSSSGTEGLVAYGAIAQKASNSLATTNQGDVVGPSPVPEPEWSALLGLGLVALAGLRRKLYTR
jgi:uncharacterized protein affecting Mg2+/Co2+ transport